LQLLNNKKTDKKVAAVETTAPVKEKEDIGTPAAPAELAVITQPLSARIKQMSRNDAALEYSKKTFAKLDMPSAAHRLRDIASAYSFASNSELQDPEENISQTGIFGYFQPLYFPNDPRWPLCSYGKKIKQYGLLCIR